MPVKIEFQVISVSGEDERYRAAELNYHGPTVRGWRSEVGCTFPQEIILQLKVLTVLQKIQILSHQYLIPQKIEICTCLSFHENNQLQNIPDLFENLGFITFSDNKATGFRSRELKSVFIPRIKAKYVKLIIHDNHTNIKNIYNQVSLVGINIIGEVQSTFDEDEINRNTPCFSYSSFDYEVMSNSNYMSPYDDLAFEMYVDEETARLIKKIEFKKHQAIFEENFDYANALKQILENLRAAGEIIGLYEQEKKQAIQFEDYDRAKSKKLQIDNFREKVYIELHIDEILQSDQVENDNYRENHQKYKLASFPESESFRNQSSVNVNHNKFLNWQPTIYINSNNENKYLQKRGEFYVPFKSENNKGNNNLIQSKSHTSLSQSEPSEVYKKQVFAKSLSTPYLNQYLKQKQASKASKAYQKSKTNYASELTSPVETLSVSQYSEEDEPILSSSTGVHSLNFISKNETLASVSNSREVINKKTYDSVESTNHPSQSNISVSLEKLLESKKNELAKSESKNDMTNTTKSSFEIYEDSMLPALKNYQKNEVFRECQLLLDKQVKTTLNEREKKQALLPISVFGIEMVEKFYSKNFIDKEEGLKELQLELKKMANAKNETTKVSYNKIARAALFLLQRTLRDTVYAVYSKATETIRQFFKEFVPQRVSQSEIARSVEKLLPELLTKSGDVIPRIHNTAAHTLLSIAECEEVRRLHIISSHLSRPLTSSVHPRLALSRLEMVEQLMLNQGISKDKRSGLTCRTLAEFGSSGLHHPAEAVRKVSERILLQVYKVNPKIVRKQLPPDDNITRRNLLYRQLFQEFDSMDLKNVSINDEKIKKSISESKNITNEENNTLILSENFNVTKTSARTVKKKQLNLDLQSETTKQYKALNSGENRKIKTSPGNGVSTFPTESRNKHQSRDAIKEKQTVKQLNSFLSKDNVKSKNLISTANKKNEENLEPKKQLASKVAESKTLRASARSTLKFPCLIDSIDVATVRILLNKDADKNLSSKKVTISQKKFGNNSTFNKTQPCQGFTFKKEIKGSKQTQSNIPIPVFYSKKNFHTKSIKKSFDEPINRHNVKKNKIENPGNFNETLETDYESVVKNGPLLNQNQTKVKHKNHNLKEESGKQTINLKNNIEMEESYRFSGSMMASIRGNEFAESNFPNEQKDQTRLKSCIFCLSSKKWTLEADLNKHYLNDCPMLMACEYCMEVVEISGYTNHLLDECNQKHLFKKCLKCRQAVLEDFYNSHECKALHLKKNQTRCLFCHLDLTDEESSWRKHLMGGNEACSNHPRKIENT